jgi:hypothetical protein
VNLSLRYVPYQEFLVYWICEYINFCTRLLPSKMQHLFLSHIPLGHVSAAHGVADRTARHTFRSRPTLQPRPFLNGSGTAKIHPGEYCVWHISGHIVGQGIAQIKAKWTEAAANSSILIYYNHWRSMNNNDNFSISTLQHSLFITIPYHTWLTLLRVEAHIAQSV